jgi:hypothetical protein
MTQFSALVVGSLNEFVIYVKGFKFLISESPGCGKLGMDGGSELKIG